MLVAICLPGRRGARPHGARSIRPPGQEGRGLATPSWNLPLDTPERASERERDPAGSGAAPFFGAASSSSSCGQRDPREGLAGSEMRI